MKLSIIVPLYNCEKYISNCLDSLLNQNLSQDEYEIVIRKKANNVINDLKNINCYKYKRLSTTDYPGVKYTILAFILNNEILFKALCG